MKCIIAIAFAMFVRTVCMAQTVSGLISYPHAGISGTTQCPQTLSGSPVYPVSILLTHGTGSQSSVSSTMNGYNFTGVSITPGSITLYPSSIWMGNNAWLNGVTVADQSMVQQHILNNTPLLCPFRLIAADMNTSGTISTSDVLAIQSLLVNGTVPNNQPWRFIAKNLVMPDFNPDPIFLDKFWSSNPFAATTVRNGKFFKYSIVASESWLNVWQSSVSAGVTQPLCTEAYGFFAIKMGDVSGDAQPANLGNYQPLKAPRVGQEVYLIERSVSELRSVMSLLVDERYEVKITAIAPGESICAYQVGLKFEDQSLSFEKNKKTKERALKQSDDNFTTNKELLDKGDFRSAWTIDYAVDKTGFEPDREVELFSFNVKAKKDIAKITDAVSLDKTTIDALFFNYDVKPIKDVKLFISIRQLQPGEE